MSIKKTRWKFKTKEAGERHQHYLVTYHCVCLNKQIDRYSSNTKQISQPVLKFTPHIWYFLRKYLWLYSKFHLLLSFEYFFFPPRKTPKYSTGRELKLQLVYPPMCYWLLLLVTKDVLLINNFKSHMQHREKKGNIWQLLLKVRWHTTLPFRRHPQTSNKL